MSTLTKKEPMSTSQKLRAVLQSLHVTLLEGLVMEVEALEKKVSNSQALEAVFGAGVEKVHEMASDALAFRDIKNNVCCPRCRRAYRFDEEIEHRLCAVCIRDLLGADVYSIGQRWAENDLEFSRQRADFLLDVVKSIADRETEDGCICGGYSKDTDPFAKVHKNNCPISYCRNILHRLDKNRDQLWPEVREFARLMQNKLDENLASKGRRGWITGDDVPKDLQARLRDEVRELDMAVSKFTVTEGRETKKRALILVGREAADVGNFAMMIHDLCAWMTGKKSPEQDK